MTPVFEVLKPGMLATVQDLGRWGHQGSGMVVSGAMDAYALQAGNLLVGNARGAAALEMTVRGPELRAKADALIAVCGADLNAQLDGKPLPLWKSVAVRAGQTLGFGAAARGAWGYLCIAGGLDVPLVMGSRSTYLRAGLGGIEGRALKAGDTLRVLAPNPSAREGRGLAPRDIPEYSAGAEVRALPGPQDDAFTQDALEGFFSAPYLVTAQSDRMGYRLRGAALEFRETGEILSDAVALGSIQVPPDGQPIALLADRQTTGGYAKIATVVSADIPKLAQLAPGGRVTFKRVNIEDAQDLAEEREAFFVRLAAACGVT